MTILFSAAFLLAVFFLIVMAVDCSRFVIKTYKCRSGRLKGNVRLVLLSDLHNKSFGRENKKLLEAIDKIKPDMILTAGDMFTSAREGDIDTARKLVCALAARYPVYYGNGNHEQKTRLYPECFGSMYREFAEDIGKAGAGHLINEKVYLPSYNMDIYGLEMDRKYYAKWKKVEMEKGYLGKLLGQPDKSRFTLLIAHNPDYFKAYADWGADLVVSGHVHGGLMRLPVLGGVISPTLRLFPKYDGGEFKMDQAVMILSRGLGTHTLPIRIFNPGELVVIELSES